MMRSDFVNEIFNKIKSSKKYQTISSEIIYDEIRSFLKRNPDLLKKEKIEKKVIKEIKKRLHKLNVGYQIKKSKRNKLIKKLEENPSDFNLVKKILSTSVSTKERLENYEELYKKIFEIVGKPKILVDLGCGLNPFSFFFMNLKKLDYYAYDINEEEINFLNRFFKLMKNFGLNGRAEILNLKNKYLIEKIPESDVIFMFKVVDLINEKNKKLSEEIIKILIKKTKSLVVSFSTKTFSRKRMNYPQRKWFELMLKRINLKFKKIELENEKFYIITN